MKKALLLTTILAVLAGVLAFRDELRGLLYARAMLAALSPDAIDETFRTMHLREPSREVVNRQRVLPFPEAPVEQPFPDSFSWLGVRHDSRELLDETHTTGLAIAADGALVYEYYDRGNTASTPAIQMSVGKSYTSFLIGTLFDDGLIASKQDPIEAYVPSMRGTAFEGVTIENLLDMSSGIRWVEAIGDPRSELFRNIVARATGKHLEFIRSLEREVEPGTFHRYATGNMYPLIRLVENVSGMSYASYFEKRLWGPLGAEYRAFIRDAGAMPAVAVRDMLRFGQLYLDEGRNLAGEQLVSAEWVRVSTTPDAPRLMPGADNPLSSSHHGYKHLWWVPVEWDEDFVALGIYGQFIYVSPKDRVVIAKTSAYPDEFEDGGWKLQKTVALFQQAARRLAQRASTAVTRRDGATMAASRESGHGEFR